MALRRADAADHGGRRVRAPVDRAVGLADQRPGPAGDARIAVVDRRGRPSAGGDGRDRVDDGVDRGAPDLVAVEAALACLARAERPRGPDVAAVDLAGRLEHRHAPLGHPELDRPVERGRPAIALGPGCTTRQRCRVQTVSGMIVLSIGQTISSGAWRATAASMAAPESTTSTATRWPSSVSATRTRWLRLLWAEARNRIRSGRSPAERAERHAGGRERCSEGGHGEAPVDRGVSVLRTATPLYVLQRTRRRIAVRAAN